MTEFDNPLKSFIVAKKKKKNYKKETAAKSLE